MTERGRRHVWRDACHFQIGPSALHWDGAALQVDIDERCVPLPRPLRGRVRLHPGGLCPFVTPLDVAGRHRWGPIAPCARVEVDLSQPGLRWQGAAYMDSNEGEEPVEHAFADWDWSRAVMHDGSTSVIYDVRPLQGPGRVIARRFLPDGRHEGFVPPRRHPLPTSMWRIARQVHAEDSPAPRLMRTLEDTPFYVRSQIASRLLGQDVVSIHETLDVPRVASLPVRLMLPWRMPRRG